MREQNKKLFNDKHQLQKIFLSANDLMLKHDIRFSNKYNLKFIFRWNKSFRIQRTNSMKDIYILKEINETCLKKTYADNWLKRFEITNAENSSTKQIKIYKMLNITFENSIDAMKKLNIINKNVRIDDEIRNEAARNIVENLNTDNQIFEDNVINNNLLNSKIWNIHARIKFSTRRLNRLTEIENLLSSVEWSTNKIVFATIVEVSIEKKWNAMKIEKFEIYTNDCNSENFWSLH